jgi:hypothetical protein
VLPPFTHSGLVADYVVAAFYFAFVEMDQNEDDVITACEAYLVLQEENKILRSSFTKSK